VPAVPPHLLRSHVGGGPGERVGKGEDGRVDVQGQAEVAEDGLPAPARQGLQEDVAGLDVPVDETVAVGILQGLGHLGDEGHDLLQLQVVRGVLQRGAPHQLHGDARNALVGLDVIDPADVGVLELGLELGFVHEAHHGRGLDVVEDLEGHHAAQDGVPGLHHVPHAAVAQEGAQHVASALLPRLEPVGP